MKALRLRFPLLALLATLGLTAESRQPNQARFHYPSDSTVAATTAVAQSPVRPPMPSHYIHNPAWWTERGILVEGAAPNNYGPANIGQLKNMTRGAILEMEQHLPGGAGSELLLLRASWDAKPKQESHFSPANQGQVKNLASKVYDRLIAEGCAEAYPWTSTTADDSHFSPINIGQLKFIFSFDPRPFGSPATAKLAVR